MRVAYHAEDSSMCGTDDSLGMTKDELAGLNHKDRKVDRTRVFMRSMLYEPFGQPGGFF